jgi:hypothetical protein
MSRLTRVALPDFGRSARRPLIPVEVYRARLDAAAARVGALGLDLMAVYADREHAANLAYLTGFDPRFEEALLLLRADGSATLLAGNECMGYLPDERLGIPALLYQDFSLPGQPRDRSRPLADLLRELGVGNGTRVGCAGWKTPDPHLAGRARTAIELPSYLVDTLRELTGATDRVVDANGIFNDPQTGLRLVNEPIQVAQFEYAATRASDGIAALLRALTPGVREFELEHHLRADGLTLSCHRMISFGAKARRGLSSPGDDPARVGDPMTTAFGVAGALTCRAGCVAASASDLPAADRAFYDALVRNYYDVVATWYRSVKVGALGAEVFRAVDRVRDPALFRFALNPGHYLHLDEWVHSPFAGDSAVVLGSGAALQLDIIPVSAGPFYCANAEDGIVLADAALRARLRDEHPDAWQRIEARRGFMRDALGIELDPSVLPLSNLAGWVPPYFLDLGQALVA